MARLLNSHGKTTVFHKARGFNPRFVFAATGQDTRKQKAPPPPVLPAIYAARRLSCRSPQADRQTPQHRPAEKPSKIIVFTGPIFRRHQTEELNRFKDQ
jgi:hypothetical protein